MSESCKAHRQNGLLHKGPDPTSSINNQQVAIARTSAKSGNGYSAVMVDLPRVKANYTFTTSQL